MSTSLKVILGLFGFMAITALVAAFSFMGMYNAMVSQEKGVVYQYEQNKNSYDNMWKKFREGAQVTDMYAADLEKVFQKSIQARYGEEGSQAAFQWIKEHNPNLDSSIYRQLQALVESGRNSFQENQTTLLDKKQQYETYLQSFPNNIIAGAMGFPKVDLSKFNIVTSDRTQGAFDKGKDDEVKLR